MSQDHQSFFGYTVTRPFPFRWYTPSLILGGVLCTVVFTFLNLASSGYDMIVQTSVDPNITVSQQQWLRFWPSYLTSKIKPECQSADLPINGQFFTNQTALTYVLVAVWQQQKNGSMTILPSLTYHNNILESCYVTSIGIDLEALDQAANQLAYSEWNAVVRTYVTCQITNVLGTTFFNLSQTYNYVPASTKFSWVNNGFLGTEFLARDQEGRASLWWGESLMSNYWAYLTRLMQDIRKKDTSQEEYGIRKGTMHFTPQNNSVDLSDLDFFKLDYRFVVDQGAGRFDVVHPLPEEKATISFLDQVEEYPNVWIPADTLAKSAYSTILADLGQPDKTSVSNMLSNATALQYFTANFTMLQSHIANAEPGPERKPYDTLRAATGPLHITPSVISTKYLCQAPQLKSAGNLFVAILVADLVLLRTVWQLFKFGAETYLVRSRPNAMSCEGCITAGLVDNSQDGDQVAQQCLSETLPLCGRQYDMVPLDVLDTTSTLRPNSSEAVGTLRA